MLYAPRSLKLPIGCSLSALMYRSKTRLRSPSHPQSCPLHAVQSSALRDSRDTLLCSANIFERHILTHHLLPLRGINHQREKMYQSPLIAGAVGLAPSRVQVRQHRTHQHCLQCSLPVQLLFAIHNVSADGIYVIRLPVQQGRPECVRSFKPAMRGESPSISCMCFVSSAASLASVAVEAGSINAERLSFSVARSAYLPLPFPPPYLRKGVL